ncbi:Chloroperoxidase [Leptodontidium sp. 2 PMI_412]|nr:Chloroperoxidase [Leptodontidium sp. MPI-SDFR-AT-0119]KAH9224860.1 Chloroperoxidase [Leptodontidium sp. 2 PMI_412]
MKLTLLSTGLAVTIASAMPHYERQYPTTEPVEGDWIPGGPNDFRGPCPMMNTLANHGFIPRDGNNLTRDNVVHGLTTALNFDPVVANIMWEQAIFINPEPNATFFTLDQLNVHNVLEHDASLSRSDALFGNNHVFNQSVFDTTIAFWTKETLDANQLAMGKVFRQVVSKATNPEYKFTANVENFSLGELAAPILIFGDIASGTCNRAMIISFFENERLPVELGFVKQASPIILDQVLATSKLIADAANLITPTDNSTETAHKRRAIKNTIRDLHIGSGMTL